jgi:hypothetical protein
MKIDPESIAFRKQQRNGQDKIQPYPNPIMDNKARIDSVCIDKNKSRGPKLSSGIPENRK